jgi:hypothetical protein
VDLLHRTDPDAVAAPGPADYRLAAQRLAPLVNRVANGEDLTVKQLADVALAGWQLLDGLLNAPLAEHTRPSSSDTQA